MALAPEDPAPEDPDPEDPDPEDPDPEDPDPEDEATFFLAPSLALSGPVVTEVEPESLDEPDSDDAVSELAALSDPAVTLEAFVALRLSVL